MEQKRRFEDHGRGGRSNPQKCSREEEKKAKSWRSQCVSLCKLEAREKKEALDALCVFSFVLSRPF